MATSLFSGVSDIYFDDTDRRLQNKMSHFYTMAQPMTQTYWWEAAIDCRYEAGDSSVFSEVYGNIPSLRRKQFTFNKIRPKINNMHGIFLNKRKSLVAVPMENGDQETADQFSKIFFWLNQKAGIDEAFSTAYRNALITGLSFVNLNIDYTEDPISGDFRADATAYNEIICDPYFRKYDMSDCSGMWRRQYLSTEALVYMWPDLKEYILAYSGWNNTVTEGLFPLMPENFGPDFRKKMPYDQYYYATTRKQTMLYDTLTGESFEWTGSNDEVLRQFLFFKPQIVAQDRQCPTVNVALLLNGKVVYDGRQPSQLDSYPFIPVFGFYNPQIPEYHLRIQGVVRSMRDAQFLYNRRMIIEADTLESVPNSGFIFKENALINPKDVYLTGQGRGIALKNTAQMSDIQPIIPPVLPPSNQQYRESLSKDMTEVTGMSEENVGVSTDEMSGILAMTRMSAGLTGMAPLLSQADSSFKLIGKKLMQMIQRNFTPGKVQRILNQEPSAQFYNRTFGQYDVAVEEGFFTETQKQQSFAQLVQLHQLGLKEITGDILLEQATIQDKGEVIKKVKQNQEQASQLQQMQFEMQMKEMEARIQALQGKAYADENLGEERHSRIAENRSLVFERLAEANKDDEQAVLNKVKAIKELESMEMANFGQLISLAERLKGEEHRHAQEPREEILKEVAPRENRP